MSLEELHHAIEYGPLTEIRRFATRDNVNEILHGQSALYVAVAYEPHGLRDDPTTVSFLLSLGADPNYEVPFDERSTPLFEASLGGRGRVARVLADAGADAGWLSDGNSVLTAAAGGGLVEMVSRALEKLDADLVRGGTTPLMEACIEDHVEACRLLVSHGADPSRSLHGNSALGVAIENGAARCFDYLLTLGVDIEQQHLRVLLDAEMAPELLEDVTEALMFDAPRFEPWACDSAYRQLALKLRQKLGEGVVERARATATAHRREYLGRALSEGDFVRFTVFFDASAAAKDELRGLQALSFAVETGQHEVASLLIDSGFEIDSDDYELCPLLTTALENGHEDVVELLLAAGADPNECREEEGQGARSWSPLAIAADADNGALVRRLVEAGAKTDEGQSPLHDAASAEMVDLLMSLGAVPDDGTAPSVESALWERRWGAANRLKELGSSATQKSLNHALRRFCNDGDIEAVAELLRWGAMLDGPRSQNWSSAVRAQLGDESARQDEQGQPEPREKDAVPSGGTGSPSNRSPATRSLFEAIDSGKLVSATAALESGADANHVRIRGVIRSVESPLTAAIASGHNKMVDLLLEHGAGVPPGERLFGRATSLSMRQHLRSLGYADSNRSALKMSAR